MQAIVPVEKPIFYPRIIPITPEFHIESGASTVLPIHISEKNGAYKFSLISKSEDIKCTYIVKRFLIRNGIIQEDAKYEKFSDDDRPIGIEVNIDRIIITNPNSYKIQVNYKWKKLLSV